MSRGPAADGVKGGRHDHSLQALAVRDRTVYVARRPELPDNRISAYLDVEGLPDRLGGEDDKRLRVAG